MGYEEQALARILPKLWEESKGNPRAFFGAMMKFTWHDYLVAGGVGLNVGSRLITNYVTTTLSSYVATANVIESNPTAQFYVSTYYLNFLASFVVIGLVVTYYIWLRRQAIGSEDKTKLFFYEAFTVIVFILCLADFLNDGGTLLGMLFNHG